METNPNDHVTLQTATFVDQAIDEEVKEIRVQQKERFKRGLTDLTLLLLANLIVFMAWLYLLK